MTICLQHSSHGNSNSVCRSSEIFAAQTKCLKCRLKRISNDLRILGLHISRKNIRFRDLKKKKKSFKKLRQARVSLQRRDYVTRRNRFLSNFNEIGNLAEI